MKRWELSPPQPLQAMRLAAATDYVVALAIWVVAQVVPPALIRAVRFTGRSSGGVRTGSAAVRRSGCANRGGEL
jgi:hypothetical protein